MSYYIELLDPITKHTITINEPHYLQGGTYQVGGSYELNLNITYNYANILKNIIKVENSPSEYKSGIRALYNMVAADVIPILEKAASKLKNDINSDYWLATEGNVKSALNNLLTLCKMRPDAIIYGD